MAVGAPAHAIFHAARPAAPSSLSWPPTARFLETPKPAGGFFLLTVPQLLLPWQAYHQDHIDLLTLRAYLAASEMQARRCRCEADAPARYGAHELRQLLGPRVRACQATGALYALQTCGLLTASEHALQFIQTPTELRGLDLAGYEAMRDCLPPGLRQLPVPRRLLRHLAREGSPGLIATSLGVVLRCLRYTERRCRAGGAVSAAWIAQCFGLSERTVYRGLQALEALGWLGTVSTPQWHRQKYGTWRVPNLAWASPIPPISPQTASPEGSVQLELFPPEAEATIPDTAPVPPSPSLSLQATAAPGTSVPGGAAGMPTDAHDGTPMAEMAPTPPLGTGTPAGEPPDPAPGVENLVTQAMDQQGPCKNLAVLFPCPGENLAVASVVSPRNSSPARLSSCIHIEPFQETRHPELNPFRTPGACSTPTAIQGMMQTLPPADGLPRLASSEGPPMAPTRIPSVPSLAHVTLDDLRDLDRVLALAEQAVPRGWLTRCEMDRLNAAAAAVHAQRQADHNPGGLFVAMLQDRRWHLITQAEEDEARGWLRDHDWGSPRRTVPAPSSLAPPPELSNDARVVEVARRVLAQAGWRGDPFLGLKVQDPTWTRERWERALAALENDRLQRRQAQARLTRLQAIVSPDGLWQDLEDNG